MKQYYKISLGLILFILYNSMLLGQNYISDSNKVIQQKTVIHDSLISHNSTNSIKFGVGIISAISQRNKSHYTWDEYYYMGFNNSIIIFAIYNNHCLLVGTNHIYIPDNKINDYSNNSNKNNLGILCGYRYYSNIYSPNFNIFFQYLFNYTNIQYQSYSLGQGIYNSDYNSIESSIGLGLNYFISKNWHCFIGLNVGFRDQLENDDDIIGVGSIGVLYNF